MIRLVTQFDRPNARAAAATPTCGGCCCCCSCVVTAASASIFTAFSAQGIHRRMQADAPGRVQPGSRSPLPGLLGFLAIPVGLFAMWVASQALPTIGSGLFVVGLAAWFGMVGLAYRRAGHPSPWLQATAIVLIASVAFVLEFFLWLAAVSSL